MPNFNKNSSLKLAISEKRKEAYKRKYTEYDLLTLEELQELFIKSKGKERIGGIYKRAMIDVASKKLQEKSLKEGTLVTEMPTIKDEVNDIRGSEQPSNNNIQS